MWVAMSAIMTPAWHRAIPAGDSAPLSRNPPWASIESQQQTRSGYGPNCPSEARPSSWLSLAGPSQVHALGPHPTSAPPQGPLSWVLSPAMTLLQGPSLGSPVGGNRHTPCYNQAPGATLATSPRPWMWFSLVPKPTAVQAGHKQTQ